MKRRLVAAGLAGSLSLAALNCAPQDNTPAVVHSANPGPTAAPAQKVTLPQMPDVIKSRLDAALENVHARDLRPGFGFWTIFHGILGMGPDTTLFDPDTGKRLNALDEICKGGKIAAKIQGLKFLKKKDGLDVETQVGTGMGEGHQDQFIAEMAQWGMPRTKKIVVDGQEYTFEDFTRHSKLRASVKENQELSWAVLIVADYYGTDHKWTNSAGEPMTLEDVARYEREQPLKPAACGGTHRLFGLTWAYHRHLERGGKKEGVWLEVAQHIEKCKQAALKYQNGDGSFSTDYVSGPGFSPDLALRLASTGHVLEWLALAMTREELVSPGMQHAASALADMILRNADNALDGGALYHATHGLHIYRTRVFGTEPPRGLVIPLAPEK